jgi:hypothetical protein
VSTDGRAANDGPGSPRVVIRSLLAANARVVETRTVSEEGRVIFLYDRS